MKRIIVVVGVVLGLGAIGLTAAHADNSGYSTWCTDSGGSSTNVPNPFVGLSYESYPHETWVCYSTTPNGSTNPETAGGNVVVWNAGGSTGSECRGDRNASQTVVIECYNRVDTTDPTSAPGSTVSGSFKIGTTGPVPVGQTGAEFDPSTTTNLPLAGAAGSGGSLGVGGNNCTWINGSKSCPLGSGATIGGVTVNEGDVSVGTYTTPGSCITVGGGCPATVPSGVGVDAFEGDPSNDTVTVNVLGSPISRDLGDCYVGVNAPSAC